MGKFISNKQQSDILCFCLFPEYTQLLYLYELVGECVGRGTLHLYVLVGEAVYGRGRGGRGIDGRGNDDREKDVVPKKPYYGTSA